MTEIEKVKGEIKVLQAKLSLLEEMEKTSIQRAYKDWWGEYPKTGLWSNYDETRWVGFQGGYEAHQSLVDAANKIIKDALMINCCSDIGETAPPGLTASVFREKLFNGIRSVFCHPDYERTYWKMKVNMVVDEVLTHFYDVIPDKADFSNKSYDGGWNDCIDAITTQMELAE
jgi:hypothetical protein